MEEDLNLWVPQKQQERGFCFKMLGDIKQISKEYYVSIIFFRIHEVNQHLNCLMSSDMTFPMSINLAVGGAANNSANNTANNNNQQPKDLERQISRLKDQNRLLTEEVSKKSKAMTVLDQEKSALIRDLFQARARLRQAELNEAEATFM